MKKIMILGIVLSQMFVASGAFAKHYYADDADARTPKKADYMNEQSASSISCECVNHQEAVRAHVVLFDMEADVQTDSQMSKACKLDYLSSVPMLAESKYADSLECIGQAN